MAKHQMDKDLHHRAWEYSKIFQVSNLPFKFRDSPSITTSTSRHDSSLKDFKSMAKIVSGRIIIIIINNKQVMSRLGDENWLHQRPTPYMDAGIPKMGSVCEESDGKLGVPYFLAKPLFIFVCVRVSFLIQTDQPLWGTNVHRTWPIILI